MAIISQENEKEKSQNKNILKFSQNFQISKLLEKCNVKKAKGVGVTTVFNRLLSIAFTGRSLNRLLESHNLDGKKDVFYRFMNCVSANWYKFIRLLSTAVIACILNVNVEKELPVLILDDTIHKRDRSKNVELLTRVRDHNDGRYYRGFRCLTLGLHTADTFIPVDFRLLSSKKEESRINGMRTDLDKRTVGYQIRAKAISGAYEMAFDMIGKQHSGARHVLFDSWFSKPVMFKELLKMELHGIGMLKAEKGVFCRFLGKTYSLANLYAKVKDFLHKEGQYVTIGVELLDGTPFSITFVRSKQNKRDWLALGTTDMTLSGREVIGIYSRRWNIEVFFKTVKSFLGFAKECQCRSFDAVVCSVAIVFTRYLMLVWINNDSPKRESMGQLFFKLIDEMNVCSFSEALDMVIAEITRVIVHIDNFLDMSIRCFLNTLPDCFSAFRRSFSCET